MYQIRETIQCPSIVVDGDHNLTGWLRAQKTVNNTTRRVEIKLQSRWENTILYMYLIELRYPHYGHGNDLLRLIKFDEV